MPSEWASPRTYVFQADGHYRESRVSYYQKLKGLSLTIGASTAKPANVQLALGRVLEAARLRQRTTFDLEMMRELGYCSGVENYSRHLARRAAGSRPWSGVCLLRRAAL